MPTSHPVPQSILDSLTDVAMPGAIPPCPPHDSLTVAGMAVPLYRCQTLVLGSGAAGLRAAVELKRSGVDVLVASKALFGGTSACSGSDKQTLHTAATSRNGDNFLALAQALGAGGAMDADTAYVEAVGSIDALGGLRYLGLPLPEDRYGAILRYQTDHDEAGRATSCGPRTSRLMVKVLAEEALRLGVPFLGRTTGLHLLTHEESGDKQRIAGMLGINPGLRTDDNPLGLVLIQCPTVVLATGGPGELYRDSVYPARCFGSLGMALEAGIEAVNLTESQFGIGTNRDGFPWNLSGTYMQSLPHIYSVDAAGTEHAFLQDYYRTTQEMVSNIFRKGYQWPFHAGRMLDYGSSLIDLAIFRETQAGRTVFMDFLRNPEPVPGDQPFSLERLDDDVAAYLRNNDALQKTPIERLRRMNPLSIELYARYNHDLTTDPLPFTVNNQHMNGGLAVDIWAQTTLDGCYAVGEIAGTHGVTRPGGAALNAGQVFAIRCARHIGARLSSPSAKEAAPLPHTTVADAVARLQACLSNPDGIEPTIIRRDVQNRMSDVAGFICPVDAVEPALREAHALNDAIARQGLHCATVATLAETMLWQQTALTSEAVLTALDAYIKQGGGSRGARALCTPQGQTMPHSRTHDLSAYRFRSEQSADGKVQLRVRYDSAARTFTVTPCSLRPLENMDGIYFEKNWPAFLTGAIYTS